MILQGWGGGGKRGRTGDGYIDWYCKVREWGFDSFVLLSVLSDHATKIEPNL